MSVYEESTEAQQFASRVIADHARSTAFAIADGILPGNEGRNYVLRKIMRRAIYHGREHLGLTDAFFYKVCDFVVGEMSGAYPELETQRDFISKMVRIEEERFGNTLVNGLKELKQVIEKLRSKNEATINVLENAISGAITVEEYSQAFESLHEQFGSESPLRQYALSVYQNKVPLDIAIDRILENVPDFQIDGDIHRAKTNFLLSLASVIREIGSDAEKSLLFAEPHSERWTRINQYFNNYDSALALTRIYDSLGLPKDLILVALEENQFNPIFLKFFDEKFDSLVVELQKSTAIGKTERKSKPSPIYAELLEKVGANQFHGYDATLITDAKVIAILDGDTPVNELAEGTQGSVVLDNTPFYAEAGGQVGDVGSLVGTGKSDALTRSSETVGTPKGVALTATVADTYSPVQGLIIHKVTVNKGSINVGDEVTASVDVEKRDATRRNHTATHLVHAALREVLGTHVKQAGSVVGPSVLRFDFTHYQPMTAAEIAEVEDLVNRYILKNDPVNTNVMAIEEAMAGGAMALFGEKYGSAVRVLSVGDGVFSKELCGGTHVRATGDIGSFKITGDEAIASGVRRIRAITGFDAFSRFREDERLIERSLHELNTQRDNLPNAIARLQEELKKTRKEMDELKLKMALGGQHSAGGESNGDETREINGVKVLAKQVDGLDANGTRQLSDTLLARLKSGVVIIGRVEEGKVGLIVRVSDDLTGKVRAGDIIREIAPIVGGRGGGKADMAEGGGTEPGKLSEAIEASYGVIEKMLS